MVGIFDLTGVEIQYFQKLKPKLETSEQDLYQGRGEVWDEANISWKITEVIENAQQS